MLSLFLINISFSVFSIFMGKMSLLKIIVLLEFLIVSSLFLILFNSFKEDYMFFIYLICGVSAIGACAGLSLVVVQTSS